MFLEALTSDVSVAALGYNFDGQSAHLGIKLMVSNTSLSTSDGLRRVIQLRPFESFHVGKHTFSLATEEYCDIYGTTYDDCTQQVSQIRSEHPLLSSPMVKSSQISPIFKQVVAAATIRTVESQDMPESPPKRAVLRTIQRANKPSELVSPLINEAMDPRYQNTIDAIIFEATTQPLSKDKGYMPENSAVPDLEDPEPAAEPRLGTPRESTIHSSEENHATSDTRAPTDSEADEDVPEPKRRKLSPPPGEESQDSLFGKSITVTRIPTIPATAPESQSISRKPNSKSRHTASSLHTPASASTSETCHTVSPSRSAEPPSPIRSTRSAVREDTSPFNGQDDGIRVLFTTSTNVGDSASFTKFLKKKGVKIVQTMAECTILCVGKELKKSAKFISAVLLGKDIVTDSWVVDSAKQGKLQDIASYFPKDPERESEWDFNLAEAVRRGREHVKVFEGITLIFTASARKEVGKTGFTDLRDIATVAGANVATTLPKKGPEETPSTLIIGTQEDTKLSSLSTWQCYTRDLISLSVLRGELELEGDEFHVASKPANGKGGKKRKR